MALNSSGAISLGGVTVGESIAHELSLSGITGYTDTAAAGNLSFTNPSVTNLTRLNTTTYRFSDFYGKSYFGTSHSALPGATSTYKGLLCGYGTEYYWYLSGTTLNVMRLTANGPSATKQFSISNSNMSTVVAAKVDANERCIFWGQNGTTAVLTSVDCFNSTAVCSQYTFANVTATNMDTDARNYIAVCGYESVSGQTAGLNDLFVATFFNDTTTSTLALQWQRRIGQTYNQEGVGICFNNTTDRSCTVCYTHQATSGGSIYGAFISLTDTGATNGTVKYDPSYWWRYNRMNSMTHFGVYSGTTPDTTTSFTVYVENAAQSVWTSMTANWWDNVNSLAYNVYVISYYYDTIETALYLLHYSDYNTGILSITKIIYVFGLSAPTVTTREITAVSGSLGDLSKATITARNGYWMHILFSTGVSVRLPAQYMTGTGYITLAGGTKINYTSTLSSIAYITPQNMVARGSTTTITPTNAAATLTTSSTTLTMTQTSSTTTNIVV